MLHYLKSIRRFLRSIYLHERFFYVLTGFVLLFFLSFWFHLLFTLAAVLLFLFALVGLGDFIALYKSHALEGQRFLPEKFSNSDENKVALSFKNRYGFPVYLEVIDEIPAQFQKRDFLKQAFIPAGNEVSLSYQLRPVERGEYQFGRLNCFISTKLRIFKRRYTFDKDQMVKVYPSFIQMKKYDFLAIDNRMRQVGLKKIRRLGHTMEFEQIKEYVRGDDVRTINWKASAKHGDLMVNQYQDEKSQPIFSLIDTSRTMKMPFNGLKLMDYAINSSLAFSNIALKKNDKVGMLSFSHQISNFLPARRKKTHLNAIQENLYNIDTEFLDSDFAHLYAFVKRKITQRSLLMLYTNFEHLSSMRRQLPFLKAISKKHLLVVVFFKNTEMNRVIDQKAENTADVYEQTIAREFIQDKKQMVEELNQYGIQTVLTAPENLTVNSINKYLEIKARGLL